MRHAVQHIVRWLGIGAIALVAVVLVSFALPVSTWRTGELPAPSLPLVKSGPPVTMARRLWIDTDAACGHGRRIDPDDCFALTLLLRASGIEVVGISSIFGNAALPITDRTVRDLIAVLTRHRGGPPVHRGSAAPMDPESRSAPAPAHAALRRALAQGPLTLVSLGPLTNIAAALHDRPDLQANVSRLIMVMGRRPGHLFHPAEGKGSGGILFGHGPVFRDFNFDQDQAAAIDVLRMDLPITLVPYQAARAISLTAADLARMTARDDGAAWLARRAQGWLDFWREAIGLSGFYPFDALAAAYAIEPRLFDCAFASIWIGHDEKLWNLFYDPPALLVGRTQDRPDQAQATAAGLYCPGTDPQLHAWLMMRLAPQ